jgi:hypothetical protein
MPLRPMHKSFLSVVQVAVAQSRIQLFYGTPKDFRNLEWNGIKTHDYQSIKTMRFPESQLNMVRDKYDGAETMEDLMLLYASSLPEVAESIKEHKKVPNAVVCYQKSRRQSCFGLRSENVYDINVLLPKPE